MMGETRGAREDAIYNSASCLLFWWASHILLFPENRAFRDKGAHLSLHPACAWHLQAHLLHQHDWQSSPKGGFLGAQVRETPGDWASDPSQARAPGTYSVTLIALAAWLTP